MKHSELLLNSSSSTMAAYWAAMVSDRFSDGHVATYTHWGLAPLLEMVRAQSSIGKVQHTSLAGWDAGTT